VRSDKHSRDLSAGCPGCRGRGSAAEEASETVRGVVFACSDVSEGGPRALCFCYLNELIQERCDENMCVFECLLCYIDGPLGE
jgi:hypothetical protein